MMNISNADRAHVLVEALPYIKKYTDKIIVIKYGGSSMIDDSLKEAVMRDVALLNLIGVKVVLVHGGGPALTETLKRMNLRVVAVSSRQSTIRSWLICSSKQLACGL